MKNVSNRHLILVVSFDNLYRLLLLLTALLTVIVVDDSPGVSKRNETDTADVIVPKPLVTIKRLWTNCLSITLCLNVMFKMVLRNYRTHECVLSDWSSCNRMRLIVPIIELYFQFF